MYKKKKKKYINYRQHKKKSNLILLHVLLVSLDRDFFLNRDKFWELFKDRKEEVLSNYDQS